MNSSYGVRGKTLYEAPCATEWAARVESERSIAAEVIKEMEDGTQTPPKTEPRRLTAIGVNAEDKRALKALYDEHCSQPLAEWLGVELSRLFAPPSASAGEGPPSRDEL